MKIKKRLSFTSLRKAFSLILRKIPEFRQSGKTKYSLHDAIMSGFACMFFQDPSLLQFQQQLKELHDMDNLQTMFDVHNIPQATQLRDTTDEINSDEFRPVFSDLFARLQRAKYLQHFQLFPGLYLCSIDATQFFSSENINCLNCLHTNHKKQIIYSHQALQVAIVHPDQKQVIPLMPEEISNSAGQDRQDCELNAAKRLIPKIKAEHPRLGIIIVADGLYSKQPFINQLIEQHMHYILVAKPDDHRSMMQLISSAEDLQEIRRRDQYGRTHLYQWTTHLPLTTNIRSTPWVNFFRYQIISDDEQGNQKIHYQNSWVTDLTITKDNIQTLVRAGRSRWKIENECFNTLKNQGYHIEHNFGHGQKYLCFNFLILTLLAFFFHQIFELTDHFYQACRNKFGSKTHLWQSLRSYIRIIIFDSFEHLLAFSLSPPRQKAPPIDCLL